MTRICLISDTHETHRQVVIPDDIDILIHAGDFTNLCNVKQVYDFLNWFKEQPAKHKIYVAGNHDELYQNDIQFKNMMVRMYSPYIHYLEDSEITIEGLKIYGSPYSPTFGDWAFMLDRGYPLRHKWSLIPDDVNILIVHGPPHSILDKIEVFGRDAEYTYESVGCKDLYNRVKQLKELKLMAMGHLHNQEKQVEIIDGTTFVNAALVDNGNKLIKQPVVVEL